MPDTIDPDGHMTGCSRKRQFFCHDCGAMTCECGDCYCSDDD